MTGMRFFSIFAPFCRISSSFLLIGLLAAKPSACGKKIVARRYFES
jgi:hypothetical protein